MKTWVVLTNRRDVVVVIIIIAFGSVHTEIHTWFSVTSFKCDEQSMHTRNIRSFLHSIDLLVSILLCVCASNNWSATDHVDSLSCVRVWLCLLAAANVRFQWKAWTVRLSSSYNAAAEYHKRLITLALYTCSSNSKCSRVRHAHKP